MKVKLETLDREFGALERRVANEAEGGASERVMLEFAATERAIGDLALRVYGAEEHRSEIAEALKVIL